MELFYTKLFEKTTYNKDNDDTVTITIFETNKFYQG